MLNIPGLTSVVFPKLHSMDGRISKEAYDFTAEVIRTLNNDQTAGKAQFPPAPTGAEAPAAPATIPKAK